ncbi:MAG: alpha-galactosidase [Bacillota bacterium]|nr:alpha-galactosidase [Bacillota bacterium]
MRELRIAIIGAGSASFSPATIADILLSGAFAEQAVDLRLMDIRLEAAERAARFARAHAGRLGRPLRVRATDELQTAVAGADFVIAAIEVERYRYWAQDFHIPRKYGFRQVYGENGGPGGMFHFLRNLEPMLEIARAMERGCPEAWLLSYTNPEAKLVEAIARLTRIRVVGLCHGEQMGIDQLARFLELPRERIAAEAAGLNHFGWFTAIRDSLTGEDLYPRLAERERRADWLADWDEYALTRILFRVFGLWSYPGANHIGEYLAWSDQYLASALLQFAHDPLAGRPWDEGAAAEFVYSLAGNPTARGLFAPVSGASAPAGEAAYLESFAADGPLRPSKEYGIPIVEAIWFDRATRVGAVNVPNRGYAPGILEGMVVEVPAFVDGRGVRPQATTALPTAIRALINRQGAIHQLLLEAYQERSRRKLLQAVLLDPTVSTYANAVAMIDELCELQAELLPPLEW